MIVRKSNIKYFQPFVSKLRTLNLDRDTYKKVFNCIEDILNEFNTETFIFPGSGELLYVGQDVVLYKEIPETLLFIIYELVQKETKKLVYIYTLALWEDLLDMLEKEDREL